MSHILYITANPKTVDQSFSLAAADAFVTAYREAHPDDSIESIDLYASDIDFLRATHMMQMGKEEVSPMRTHAEKFAVADRYIIAAPMWNFGIPAILKAYIDYVSFAGITFKYTESGPVGLLTNKKMMFITASGGSYGDEAMRAYDYCGRYMRTVMGFFGITDFEEINIPSTAMTPDQAAYRAETVEKARMQALSW